jgi:hypothetical protein
MVAKGHGWSAGLEEDVCFANDYVNERDMVDVDVIGPNTEVCISTDINVPAGGEIDVTVTEENLGDDPISDVSVTVSMDGDLLYTLVKGDDFWVGGDTNDNGILDPDDPATEDVNDPEVWTWLITGVVVEDTTTFEAIGDGVDSAGNNITWPEYPDERDRITIGTIGTELCINSCCGEPELLSLGELAVLTITERNIGDVPINEPYVWVGARDLLTGAVIDINTDPLYDPDHETNNGFAMGKADPHYAGGDTNGNSILDPGEIWTWVITDVEFAEDAIVTSKGHGWVSGVEGDITYPEYPYEMWMATFLIVD